MLDRPKFRMHARFSLRVTLKFRGCSILILQKIPIMLKYNVYLRIQSEVARKQKRAYDINKMSKTFEMTINRLRFSKLSLSPVTDHNYFRPTRARRPRSTTTSHILKRSTYFVIISVNSTVAVPILSFPCQFGIFVLIR